MSKVFFEVLKVSYRILEDNSFFIANYNFCRYDLIDCISNISPRIYKRGIFWYVTQSFERSAKISTLVVNENNKEGREGDKNDCKT